MRQRETCANQSSRSLPIGSFGLWLPRLVSSPARLLVLLLFRPPSIANSTCGSQPRRANLRTAWRGGDHNSSPVASLVRIVSNQWLFGCARSNWLTNRAIGWFAASSHEQTDCSAGDVWLVKLGNSGATSNKTFATKRSLVLSQRS